MDGEFLVLQERLRTSYRSGEYRLLLACLDMALFDVREGVFSRAIKKQNLCREAIAWFDDRSLGAPYSFTFEYVCAHLNFNSAAIREAINRWYELEKSRRR